MNKSAVLLAGALLWASGQGVVAGPAGSPATPASRVFAIASPSIVVIEALDAQQKPVAFGSGVVIAKDVVVSNCHVITFKGTASAIVVHRQKQFPTRLRYGDPENDLCSFTVEGLDAPPVAMGSTAALAVGDKVYAIGAPEGYDLTLSDGLVSSLRKLPNGVVIQTTAPISPGSSGGGLFDSQGRLVGITSYQVTAGQQLNFALPVEWVEALPRRGKTASELAAVAAPKPAPSSTVKAQGANPPIDDARLRRGDLPTTNAYGAQRPESSFDLAHTITLAEQGNSDAQFDLGSAYDVGTRVPKDDAKAVYWYKKAAEQGLGAAQNNLGVRYRDGKGVPQDYTKALYWFGQAARQGDETAQMSLGEIYLSGHGIAQNYAKALYWFNQAAAQGDPDAQIYLGWMYYYGLGTARDYPKVVYFWNQAAQQAVPKALLLLGVMYDDGKAVPQDSVEAAKWFILAKAVGGKDVGNALHNIERKITARQIAEAQTLAGLWWDTRRPPSQSAGGWIRLAPRIIVTSVELGRAVGSDYKVTMPTTTFDPKDVIYASVSTAGSAKIATLGARWSYQDGQTVNSSSENIAPNGSAATAFHIAKPDGWPSGNYEVEIFLDGRAVATKAFSVR